MDSDVEVAPLSGLFLKVIADPKIPDLSQRLEQWQDVGVPDAKFGRLFSNNSAEPTASLPPRCNTPFRAEILSMTLLAETCSWISDRRTHSRRSASALIRLHLKEFKMDPKPQKRTRL